jgi:hypothetical protein
LWQLESLGVAVEVLSTLDVIDTYDRFADGRNIKIVRQSWRWCRIGDRRVVRRTG